MAGGRGDLVIFRQCSTGLVCKFPWLLNLQPISLESLSTSFETWPHSGEHRETRLHLVHKLPWSFPTIRQIWWLSLGQLVFLGSWSFFFPPEYQENLFLMGIWDWAENTFRALFLCGRYRSVLTRLKLPLLLLHSMFITGDLSFLWVWAPHVPINQDSDSREPYPSTWVPNRPRDLPFDCLTLNWGKERPGCIWAPKVKFSKPTWQKALVPFYLLCQ